MKFLLFILGLILPGSWLLADGGYPTYRLTVTVELTNGSSKKVYCIAQDQRYEPDSVPLREYLEKTLNSEYAGDDVPDTLIFHKDMLEYAYVWPETGGDTVHTFQLVNEVKIAYKAIKRIRVNTYVESGWEDDIINDLKLSDAKWFKKAPVKHVNLNGYLCGFLVVVHKSDKKVEAILKEVEALQKKYLDDMDPEKQQGNEEMKYPEYDIDNELYAILKKLQGRQVVVIQSCSC